MVDLVADRVKETSTTTGTGAYALAGAAVGFQSFVAGIGNAKPALYAAENGTDWEVGVGTVTDGAPDTLSRDTILASSASGSAVNWAAGTKQIFVTQPAARSVVAPLLAGAGDAGKVLTVNPTGTGYVNAAPAAAAAFRGVLVRRNTPFTLAANSGLIPIPWTLEDYDTDGMWSAANPTRVIVPAGATRAIVRASAFWDELTAPHRGRSRIQRNGSAGNPGDWPWMIEYNTVHPTGASDFMSHVHTIGPVPVTPGDYFELECFNYHGSNPCVIGHSTDVAEGRSGYFSWLSLEIVA